MQWSSKDKKLIKLAVALGRDLNNGMSVEEASEKYGVSKGKLEEIAKDLTNLYNRLQLIKERPISEEKNEYIRRT